MPEKETLQRARRARARGKSPSTQAGEFVREEIHHVREGKHGARSAKQAIAIGLSKARRAGVRMPAPKRGTTSADTREQAQRDLSRGRRRTKSPASKRRSQAVHRALEHEGHAAASHQALSRQAHAVAKRRGPAARRASARKAVQSRTHAERSASARKAARTRAQSR